MGSPNSVFPRADALSLDLRRHECRRWADSPWFPSDGRNPKRRRACFSRFHLSYAVATVHLCLFQEGLKKTSARPSPGRTLERTRTDLISKKPFPTRYPPAASYRGEVPGRPCARCHKDFEGESRTATKDSGSTHCQRAFRTGRTRRVCPRARFPIEISWHLI